MEDSFLLKGLLLKSMKAFSDHKNSNALLRYPSLNISLNQTFTCTLSVTFTFNFNLC